MAGKRPVVSKGKRARELAARLKDELGLDVCEPLLTAVEAAEYGHDMPAHQIAVYMQREMLRRIIPLNKKEFSRRGYNDADEDYFFNLIARVWLAYLKAEIADALYVLAGEGVLHGQD